MRLCKLALPWGEDVEFTVCYFLLRYYCYRVHVCACSRAVCMQGSEMKGRRVLENKNRDWHVCLFFLEVCCN